MPRQLFFAFATALFALSAIAILGEVVARGSGRRPLSGALTAEPWSTPHPELGWINLEGTSRSNEPGHAPMTFWSGGRRRSRETPTQPLGPRQAALVGGSWFQGYGIRDEETFAWKAGELLPEWGFENFGTGGYGTLQAALSAEIGIREGRLAPDLIVYGFATFHGMRNVQTFDWVAGLRHRSGERLIPPHAAFVDGRIVRMPPGTLMRNWPLETSSALVRALHETAALQALAEREAWVAPITRHLTRKLAEFSTANGARFAVMTIYGGPEADSYHQFLRHRGIEHIDCRYPGHPYGTELRVGGIGHPNGTVHTFWADCLTDWMQSEFAVEPS